MDGARTLAASCLSSSWISAVYVPIAAGAYTLVLLVYLLKLSSSFLHLKATKRFSFNPAIIALLATAAKVPSDVTGTSPGILDDLLRLTAILLYCLTITLSLSAIGTMENAAIIANLSGLIIYLIVEVYNLATAPATPFQAEQRLLGAVMLFLSAIFVSHSLTVSATRRRIENKYQYRHGDLLPQSKRGNCNCDKREHPGFDFRELQMIHEKYWIMAVTSNPEWALRAWGSLLVCNILTWGVVGVGVAYRIARAVPLGQGLLPYVRSSNEKLAASLLLLHLATIVLGFLASMLQFPFFNPVPFLLLTKNRGRQLRVKTILRVLRNVENYRMEKLLEWRNEPLALRLPLPWFLEASLSFLIRPIVVVLLDIMTMLHIGTIYGCNLVLMAWAIAVSIPYHLLCDMCMRLRLVRRFEPLKGMMDYDIRLLEAKYEELDRRWIEIILDPLRFL